MFPYINNILRDVTATNLLGTLARQNLTALYRIVEYRSSPVCYLQVAFLANFRFPPLSPSLLCIFTSQYVQVYKNALNRH